MKHHREFEIAWMGLKEGTHEFSFEVTDQVLNDLDYAHPDFENLNAKVILNFEKESSFFQLGFDIDGTLDVACDRCGDYFNMRLWDEFKLIIKLTENAAEAERQNEEEEADVVFIPRSETVINVFGWIFEFIMLSIPIQKIHPNKPDGSPGCNPDALRLLKEMSADTATRRRLWEGLQPFNNPDPENPETN